MSLKISKGSLFEKSFLIVDKKGVKVYASTLAASTKRYRFDQIDCVLLAPDNKLSLQVGQDIFTIQTNPQSEKEQTVIQALLANLAQPAAV